MNIALIGYGKMGKLLAVKAVERKHHILKILDNSDWEKEELLNCDVAIDFSAPDSVLKNIHKSFQMGVTVIVGTTGWYRDIEKVKAWCTEYDGTILTATNFSLGVNIFFEMNKHLSRLMNPHSSFTTSIKETHHKEKKDSPSGTAISTAEILLNELDKYDNWETSASRDENKITIIANREPNVAGIHEVIYESDIDVLKFSHKAKNREGFASGALIAAEFINGKKGFYSMKDLLKF